MLKLEVLIAQEVETENGNKCLYKVPVNDCSSIMEVILLSFKLVDGIEVKSNEECNVRNEKLSDNDLANQRPLILKDCLHILHIEDADLV